MRYGFEHAILDTDAYTLTVDDRRVAIEPQVFEVLAYLIANRDRLVPGNELLDQIWGDRFVSPSALTSRIKSARAAIGDSGREQRCIRTVHGRGYQFVADVIATLPSSSQTSASTQATPPPAIARPTSSDRARPDPRITFVTTPDGAQLAVADVGSGPALVKAANWLTHVELDSRSPVWTHWNEALGSAFRYIRYDARGCGLSDRDLGATDLRDVDLWVSDLEAVVDASDVDRFVLLGISQGTVPAVEYTRRHPDRVSHLVVLGGYAQGMRRRDAESARRADTLRTLIEDGWGGTNPAFRSVFTMTLMPRSRSEHVRWFNELQLASASVDGAWRLESAFHDADIEAAAREITVPTLVFHGRDDLATPYEQGRRLAGAIPDAEFVTLDTPNHILLEDDPAWPTFLARLTSFVGVPDPLAEHP